jgi:hypothetical protein
MPLRYYTFDASHPPSLRGAAATSARFQRVIPSDTVNASNGDLAPIPRAAAQEGGSE